jgi:DNA-binding NarL/FixJ family response regulator
VVQVGAAETDELSLLAGLRGVRPAPHVVGLHHALDPRSLLRLHRAGAHQLVSSRFGLAALRVALDETGTGNERPPTSRLSGRELEILALTSAGCSAAEAAQALQISPHTVTNHLRRIFAKLDVHSRIQAAAEMARLGWPRPTNGHQQHPVAGRAGTLRDQVSQIVARNRADAGPEISVLVNPTGSAWLAGSARSEKVVVLSQAHPSRIEVADALSRGARAVLSDEELAVRLPAAISLVRAGYLVATNDVVRGLIAGALSANPPPTLTPREKDILESVALGHSVRQTAQSLGIAIKTVQSEQRQLFSKLGARNRLHALAQARELGLVDP